MSSTLACDRSMRSVDPDGHLRVEHSFISKACVSLYRGSEIANYQALGLDPDRTYRLLRDPAELAKAADSFTGKPLLVSHIPVSADLPNRDLWVGTLGKVTFEAPYLVSRPLMVWTQQAIDLIETEAQRELSSAYRYRADMTPGNYQGEAYDGVMREMSGNHTAIVSEGRVGPDVLVADELPLRLLTMKHAARIARLKPFLAADANLSALDAELEQQKQDDEDEAADYYGRDAQTWQKMSAEDRITARDTWKAARDKRRAKDSEVDHRNDFAGAKDSVETMRKELIAAFEAREAVKDVVGVVAMDSAPDIYAFALKHLGVKTDGVHASAYPVLFDLARANSANSTMAVDARVYRPYTLASIFGLRREGSV
jgi:hypothetical protein